jgi:serine/threonine-protein kinase
MTEPTNRRIGDYEILGELGAGGMGRVYKVRNVISDRIEAMKVLLPDLAGQQDLAARFLREIKVLAALNHPNVAGLRTALTVDNQLVMIMEYVEGTTLATRIERGPIPVPDAINYIDQVLNALSYAHQQGVIHRDIKPANMMLTPQGVIKLMDFGIARTGEDRNLTMTGTTLGSINYMSPEQVKGEPTDARSDLYAVGISMYEMVTGQRPFQADSDFSIMTAHVKEMPKPPVELQAGIPAALNEIILMAIAKEPASRFKSADAFRNALSNVRSQSATAQPVTSTRGQTIVDTSVSAAVMQSINTPTPPSRNQISSPVRTMVDAKVTPIPNTPPTPPPSFRPQATHRGLYMTLGALVVLAGLVVAGIYWPGKSKAAEDTHTTAATTKPIAPPKPTAAVKESAPEPVRTTAMKQSAVPVEKAAQVTHEEPADQSKLQDFDEVEHEVDMLSSRAAAVNSSLDRMQQQQAAAGYGLRGDMAGHQESMKFNLSRAQSALQHHDTERAKKYADLAENDVEALEKFLGR